MSKYKNIYTEDIEKVAQRVLPKFVERFHKNYNFTLPEFTIREMNGMPRNSWDIITNGDAPKFGYITVEVDIDAKDGRMGKVKKLVTAVVDQAIRSLGYDYEEDITVNFTRTGGSPKMMETVKNTLQKYLNTVTTYQGEYLMPYSEADEYVDWKIKFILEVDSVRNSNEDDCLYSVSVTMYVTELIVGFEDKNDWETLRNRYGIPEYSWEKMVDSISNSVSNILPHICIDEINYEFKNR